MPLELLYFYAVFYVNTFQNVNDNRFKQRCKDMIDILREIDDIWKLDGKSHKYNNNNNRMQLCEFLKLIFKDNDVKDLMEKQFNEKFSRLELCTNETDLEKLVISIVPTCIELMKKQSSNDANAFKLTSSSLKGSIMNKCFYDIPIHFLNLITSPLTFSLFYWFGSDSYMTTLINVSHELALYKNANTLFIAGIYEEAIRKRLKELNKASTSETYRMILCNRKIRDILLQDWIIGVVGEKKSGKSTFIEKMIPGANAGASSSVATRIMSAHEISDSVILIDYPHFDSNDYKHKLQFTFTQKLLDHTFMICEAKRVMDTVGSEQLFKTVQSHGDHFTILLNWADAIWNDEKNVTVEEKKRALDNIVNQIIELRKSKNDLNDNLKYKLNFTCLVDIKDVKQLEGMRQANILQGIKLKEKVYEIIFETIKDIPENKDVRDKFAEKIAEYKKKPETKQIKVILKLGPLEMASEIIITKNKTSCKQSEGIKIFNEFTEIVNEYKEVFNQPTFREKNNPESIIKSIDDFLNSDEFIFDVISSNSKT